MRQAPHNRRDFAFIISVIMDFFVFILCKSNLILHLIVSIYVVFKWHFMRYELFSLILLTLTRRPHHATHTLYSMNICGSVVSSFLLHTLRTKYCVQCSFSAVRWTAMHVHLAMVPESVFNKWRSQSFFLVSYPNLLTFTNAILIREHEMTFLQPDLPIFWNVR